MSRPGQQPFEQRNEAAEDVDVPVAPITAEFLHSVAHDLRSSLNTIVGWAELVRAGHLDEANSVRAGETILRHARRLSGRVNSALDIWRLRLGELQLQPAAVRLPVVARAAVSAVEPLARQNRIQISLTVDDEDCYVAGDGDRLTQAIVILLSHAVAYTPPGGAIDMTLNGRNGRQVEILVVDQGPVMTSERRPDRLDSLGTRLAGESSRLFDFELSLVHALASAHDGAFEVVEGRAGRGVFRLLLPTMDGPSEISPAVEVRARVDGNGSTKNLSDIRVLVVDDEPDAREALDVMLKLHGAIVMQAASAPDALSLLRRHVVDVLLADIGMPGQDGYDLIRKVRRLENGPTASVPAAAVTAFCTAEDQRRAIEAGFQVHLAKPVGPDELLSTILQLTRRR
jgi:CheY-like chemotaxis protein